MPLSVVLRNVGEQHEPLVRAILAKYGLTNVHSPWRSGGFSDVYEIQTGDHRFRLLRLSSVISALPAQVLADNTVEVARRAGDLMPTRHVFIVHDLGKTPAKTSGFKHLAIFESVVDRLFSVPPAGWVDFMGPAKRLMRELLQVGRELARRGVLHRDISQSNIIMSRARDSSVRFMFIDSDDACVLPDGPTCTETISSGTAGYILPEVESRRNRRVGNKQMEIGRRYGAPQVYDGTLEYKTSPSMILHNMVYGTITVGLTAITGLRHADEMYLTFDTFHFDDGWKSLHIYTKCRLRCSLRRRRSQRDSS